MRKLLRALLLAAVVALPVFWCRISYLKRAKVREIAGRIAKAEHLECRISTHHSVIDLTPDVRSNLMTCLSDYVSFPLGFKKMMFHGALFFSNLKGTNLVIEVFNNNIVKVDGIHIELTADVFEVCGMKNVVESMKRMAQEGSCPALR